MPEKFIEFPCAIGDTAWISDKAYFDYIGSDDGKKIRNMLENLIGRGRRVRNTKETDLGYTQYNPHSLK